MNNKQARTREAAIINVASLGISQAPEIIANNVDLLTEILVRLPVKYAIRFKSVSKHWLSLLSDSQFTTNHSTRNPIPSSISGLYIVEKTLNSLSLHGCRHDLPCLCFLKGLKGRSRIRIAHSSNGLLLCSINDDNRYGDQRYIVCNPTTKKYKLLPKPDGLVLSWGDYLAFYPTKSSHHYKVVLFSDYPCRIDIYNSQSSCWQKVFPDEKFSGRSAFWNGAIHWLTNSDSLKIFDVDAEEVLVMPKPQRPKILPLDNIMYFGECSDGLIIIQSRSRCPSGFRILELQRDCSCWFVKCQVNLRPLIAEFPEMEWRSYHKYSSGYNVLCAVEGENERGFAVLLETPGRIISYYPKYKTWDELCDLVPCEFREFGLQSYYALPFVETLFSV